MAISHRLSRGFHRLAIFLAAIPLLVGGYFSVLFAIGFASRPTADVSLGHDWWIKFAEDLGLGIVITLAMTLAVYGIVRAIGWVIGGFAAS